MRNSVKIDYELWVHKIPEDLRPPLRPENAHLQLTHEVWKRVVDSNLIWRVWQIDAWERPWIMIRFRNDRGEFETHTLMIDEDCHEKVKADEPYEVRKERPEDLGLTTDFVQRQIEEMKGQSHRTEEE